MTPSSSSPSSPSKSHFLNFEEESPPSGIKRGVGEEGSLYMAEGGGAGVFLRRFFLLVSFLWDSMGVGEKRAEEEVRPILFPSGDRRRRVGGREELGAEGLFSIQSSPRFRLHRGV